MVNGPPTPPATTPAELLDAARGTAPVEPSVSLPPQIDAQLRPEVYQRAVQGIGAAIARKDYHSVGSIAGEADFIVCFVCILLRESSMLMRTSPDSN